MFWLTTVLPLVGMFAALWYAHKQTVLAQQQTRIANELRRKQEEQEREVNEWQIKHEEVARRICKIAPSQLVPNGPGVNAPLYPAVFHSAAIRIDIETYIAELNDQRTRFAPRKPTELELRSPALRNTVEQVKMILDDLRQTRPELYKHFE